MKFKATLEDPKALLGVLQVCRSIQKDSVIIRLQERRTRFFTNVEIADGVQLWVGCRTDVFFRDFRCDSRYKEQSITCEVLNTVELQRVVRQADKGGRYNGQPNALVLRLSQTGAMPVLKMTMTGAPGHPAFTYDVPIRILSDEDIERMSVPALEDDRVQVVVPNLAELSTFIDKLKNTSCNSVTFSAQPLPNLSLSARGSKRSRDSTHSTGRPALATFIVHAEHFLASFSLKYDAAELVERTHAADANEEDQDDDESVPPPATVTVDLAKFARFFSTVKEVSPTRVSMFLVDGSSLVLSVQAPNGTTLVAYIPAKM